MSGLRKLLALVAGLGCALAAAAQNLRYDPFQTPADFLVQPATPGVATVTPGVRPEILGILVSGGQSLVNLGGEIIGIGEEAGGYRLLEVGEERAIFQYGEEIVTFELYPDEQEDESNGR